MARSESREDRRLSAAECQAEAGAAECLALDQLCGLRGGGQGRGVRVLRRAQGVWPRPGGGAAAVPRLWGSVPDGR